MKFGVLRDIKNGEYRVICTPIEVAAIIDDGHEVYVARGAGAKAGFPDSHYAAVGAKMLDTNEEVWKTCDFVAKVKEIEPSEYDNLRENQILFCCVHPAAHKEELDQLLEHKVTAFTAEDSHRWGSPNCEAAGKAGAFMGLWAMMSNNGGLGKFASGLGAAPRVRALVCGYGVVGRAAIEVLYNMGCEITVSGTSIGGLRTMSQLYDGKINTVMSNRQNLKQILPNIDLVVNCVRWPKDVTEPMITREMVASMPKGAVISDISNDYGCIETFHETTHDNPIYEEEGVIHYCVSNIPGAIAGSTSVAYAASVLPHIRSILNNGIAKACVKDGFLRRSLTTYNGYLTHEESSGIQNRPWVKPEVILGIEDENLDFAPEATTTVSDNFYDEFKK